MKLFVTNCSDKKRDGVLSPDQLYISRRIEKFTDYCKENGLNWAIVSAKYGLFLPSQKRSRYNTTLRSNPNFWLGVRIVENGIRLPKSQSDVELCKLISIVYTQAVNNSVDNIVFYTWSLKMAKCYLSLLHYVFDNCDIGHSWYELLECIRNCGRIIVVTQLNVNGKELKRER